MIEEIVWCFVYILCSIAAGYVIGEILLKL